jgi:hypothetical protein
MDEACPMHSVCTGERMYCICIHGHCFPGSVLGAETPCITGQTNPSQIRTGCSQCRRSQGLR